MWFLLPIFLFGLGIVRPAAAGEGVTLYVATNGSDRWSGRLAAPNAARSDGPFATLEGARDALREVRRQGAPRPATILVRGGRYVLDRTLLFTPEDSGTAEAPVAYRAYPGETPALLGGIPVRGWMRHKGGIFVASLAGQGMSRFRFHQLFFRGERQILARHPNRDAAHPHTGGLLYVDAGAQPEKTTFHYDQGEIPFERWGDHSQAEVNIFPYNCWDHNIIPISEVDTESRTVRLRYPVAGRIHEANRYFVQNVLATLDAPGEWFVDYATGNLHFWPPQGKVADGDVIVPVLENLVQISGTADEPVRHLTFHGFRLSYAEQDGVVLEGARNCAVTGNTVTGIGGVGVNAGYLRNARKGIGNRWVKAGRTRTPLHSGDRSLLHSHRCADCRIAGNDISSTGGDGIVLVGERNTADNNHISQAGLFDMVCAGVTVGGEGNTVSHNEIHDVPRDGIFINGAKNVAEYNAIRHTMLYTADNSAIALRQHNVARAVQDRGNVIRFNRILDTIGYGSYPHCTFPPKGFGSPYCSWGIYLDGSICGVTVYGNVIARSGSNSVFVQFGGGNVVENNIFVETGDNPLQFDSMLFFGWFMHVDAEGKYPEPPNEIRRNIFSYTGPKRKLYLEGLWGHPEWNEKQAIFDHNLIWHHGLPIEVEMDAKRNYHSLAQWQAAGHDRHSVVAAPKFVDAARDASRLRPDSPALGVGCRNINEELGRIGAYRSPERATWPLAGLRPKRETPVVFAYRKQARPIVDGFELTPVGSPPDRGRVNPEGAAAITVTEEIAGTGRQCLKFMDASSFQHAYDPHLVYTLGYPAGKMRFSVQAMNSKEAPAQWYMEFRDWRKDLFVGPTFSGSPDGKLRVGGRLGPGGREIATVPNGTWFTVEMEFATGAAAPKTYTLTLRVPGEKEQVFPDLPFPDRGFAEATWFGISSMSTERAVLHVDNLLLGPAGAEELRTAASAPAIRGTTRRPARAPEMRNKEGLALYWKFDEAAGEHLVDSSGNGLEGSLTGGERATGAFGRALHLDGSVSAAEVADTPLLHFGTADFTVECWLCPTMLDVDSQHKRRRLLDKGLWPTTWWDLDILSDGRAQMEIVDANRVSGTTVSQGAVKEREWTHLAVIVDRAHAQTRYYLNGKLDSARALPATFTGNLDMAGKSFTTGNWQPFIGLLDEVRVFTRALTEAEIAARYGATRGTYTRAEFTAEEP